jgi:hypothetical protein
MLGLFCFLSHHIVTIRPDFTSKNHLTPMA